MDDSDSDSDSDDEGPTLRQRRDKWRRLTDMNIRAEADPWQSGCEVPAGPREGARSERKRCQEPEMPALREGVGLLPTARVRGGRDNRGQAHHRFMINNRSCTSGLVLVCGEPAEAPLASRWLHWAVRVVVLPTRILSAVPVWTPDLPLAWGVLLNPTRHAGARGARPRARTVPLDRHGGRPFVQNVWPVRVIWLQTFCTANRSENAFYLDQTFCKQNVWRDIECKLAFFDKMHEQNARSILFVSRYRM